MPAAAASEDRPTAERRSRKLLLCDREERSATRLAHYRNARLERSVARPTAIAFAWQERSGATADGLVLSREPALGRWIVANRPKTVPSVFNARGASSAV